MSVETKTRLAFTPEEIAEAAKGNVYSLSLVAIAYARAHGLSPAGFWDFAGHEFAPLWDQGLNAMDLASGAAVNMVSAGCDLRSLSGDETRATAVLGGWPPEQRFGLSQDEADTVWGVFRPIAASRGYSYEWHRQGDEVAMTFLRRNGE